ncbi:hypothetical protein SAMN05216517_105227 [Janthinobacterium sp. OK676]|nr:hypothetical protein CLU90_3961 [Janthinobacterium sp. 67]SDM62799.1 hypothetical protein SAMN05216517_105227 [Janthinobacterium sp. OK676]
MRLRAENSGQNLSRIIHDRSGKVVNPAFSLLPPSSLVNLKKSDQALITVLVLTGETVLTENFGSYYKTFVNLRGDALIFDYKSKTVVRSYPVNAALFDATPDAPDAARIRGFIEQLLLKEEGKGLVTQYLDRLSHATLPTPGQRTIQIRRAKVAPEALAVMPEVLRTQPQLMESMVVDAFASVLSAKAGVPLLPTKAGDALGRMSLRLENGDDVDLRVGEGDYVFDITLNKFAKIKAAETAVAISYVYGAYAHVQFSEPLLNSDFLNTDLKNGETAIVPAGRIGSDDFAAYQDALRGLFLKLTAAFEGGDMKWIQTAAGAKDIGKQLEATRVILKASK